MHPSLKRDRTWDPSNGSLLRLQRANHQILHVEFLWHNLWKWVQDAVPSHQTKVLSCDNGNITSLQWSVKGHLALIDEKVTLKHLWSIHQSNQVKTLCSLGAHIGTHGVLILRTLSYLTRWLTLWACCELSVSLQLTPWACCELWSPVSSPCFLIVISKWFLTVR